MVNAYDQVRRAVTYLEWTASGQDILAPSLYAGRSTRRKPAPPAKPPAPGASTAGVTTSGATSTPSAAKIPVGMPGASPFVE